MVSNHEQNVDEPPFGGRTMLVVGLSYVVAVVVLLLVLAEGIGMRGGMTLGFALLVPLIPFLIIMAYTGRVRRVSAGSSGFEILFAQVVSREIQPIPLEDEIIEIPPGGIEAIVAGYDVEDGEVAHRPVLWFRLGEWHDPGVVDEFVENMPRLSFVVFTDPLGQFEGLMSATDFRSVYSTNPDDFLDHVEYENAVSIEGVVTETITPDATNAEALETMATENVDKLGVVDDEGEFVGVITQDAISRGILTELFRKTGS